MKKLFKKNRRILGRYQLKIAFSYLFIISGILMLLNTYPIIVSQDAVFQNKKNAMTEQARLVSSTLSGIDELTPGETERILKELGALSNYRCVVVNERGIAVFDNASEGAITGKFTLQGELVASLKGNNVYHGKAGSTAFESSASAPVLTQGRIVGAVYLYEYDQQQGMQIRELRTNLATFSIAISIIAIVLSIFISMALTSRMNGLLEAIRAVRNGEYGKKAPVRGKDELALVAGKFNELSEILSETETLRRQFVSDASHELKTPLASIKVLADSVLQNDSMSPDMSKEFLRDIGDEVERLTRLTEKLMHLTRLESSVPELRALEVAPIIKRCEHMLSPLAQKAEVSVICDISVNRCVSANRDDFITVVFNLLENAIKYTPPGGTVRILSYEKDDLIYIVVDDTGIGIPGDELPYIFQRFYRVDKARSREAGGAGLGLSIVKHALDRMGGKIEVFSEIGKGTRFSVTFPALP